MKPVNPPEQCLFLRQSYTLGLCTPSQTRHWQTILMLLRFKQLGAMGFRLVCCKVLVTDLRTGLPSVAVPLQLWAACSLSLIGLNQATTNFYFSSIVSQDGHTRLSLVQGNIE